MSATIGNITLKNPIMIGAGPWARDAESLKKCIATGAGAVVTETITLGQTDSYNPCFYSQDNNIFNIKLFSSMQLEHWQDNFDSIDKNGCLLIASIWASSPSELAYLAKKVESIGFDAIEINLSSPIGSRNKWFSERPTGAYEYVNSVIKEVRIPVIVKLSYEYSNNDLLIENLEKAGVAIVSAIDGLRGMIDINIEDATVKMPAFGGYTGDAIRPVSLAVTAMLTQNTSFDIIGVGGISTHEHAIEYLMLGAEAVQVASVIMLNGYDAVTDIINGYSEWMESHGYSKIADIRGIALSGLSPYEDLKPRSMKAKMKTTCRKECNICINSCLYQALSKSSDGTTLLHKDKCVGCGLCIERCPDDILYLDYD